MIAESVPRGHLLLWALLVPVAYAPAFVFGERPGPAATLVAAGAVALAFGAVAALGTRLLDALAARLDPLAGRLVLLTALAHFVASVAVAHARLAAFEDYNQLGLFSQSFWTQLHGHPFANSTETVDGTLGSHHAVHFSPTLFVLLPLYALWPNPMLLIAAQCLALALIPVALFHLLRAQLGGAASLVLSLAVLALPNFLWAGARDFRDANFLPVLLIGALWALERRRPVAFLAFALAALGVREEMGIAFVMIGAYALIRGHGPRVAAGIAALGLVWFVLAVSVVMPRFSSPGMWMDAKRFFVHVLGQWGATPGSALIALATHPVEVARSLANGVTARYLYTLLRPLLLAPPFGDWAAIGALPGLALNLLSRLEFMRGPEQAYSLVPMTFLGVSTARTAARLALAAPESRRGAAGLAAALVVLAGVIPSLALTARHDDPPAPPAAAAAAVVRAIPAGAAVYAPVSLYPALSNRENFGFWFSTLERAREPEFRGRYAFVALWPAGEPRDAPLADSLASDPRFARRAGFEPFVVFERR